MSTQAGTDPTLTKQLAKRERVFSRQTELPISSKRLTPGRVDRIRVKLYCDG